MMILLLARAGARVGVPNIVTGTMWWRQITRLYMITC